MPEVGYELYRVISVSGRDTVEFLQGQLTQDINLVRESAGLPAAWCNAKGRVIATMELRSVRDTIELIIADNIAEEVCGKFAMFRFRSQVDFTIRDDMTNEGISDDDRKLALIDAGIAIIAKENSEKFTPHMLNLDRLGAISFSKGCYTGQEVVARTEHLGASKRRLMRYRTSSDSAAVGDKLTVDGQNAGEVVNVAGNRLLAVTPVALHENSLSIGDGTATPLGLPYM
jgi:folate-binding protein YgfZ